jgi:uncharacterized protein YkwD
MSDKKLVSTKTTVDEKTETKGDATVKTITTTTVEEYSDGSSSTKTSIKTITEGASINQVDPVTGKPTGKSYNPSEAKKSAPRVKVTTDKDFLKAALKAHNEYRKKHHAPPLELSDDLCKVAQAWADKIAANDKMEHSENGYGENIHWSSANVTDGKAPVEHWYSEVKDYKFAGDLDYQRGTGHFTQVVWKDTKELGIAKATGKSGGTYVVANYNPSGNFVGKFAENVLKP